MDSSASRIHASFVLILLDAPLPQFFAILHAATPGSRILCGFGILLAWISSGFPDLSSTNPDTGTGEKSLLGTSSLSQTGISPTVGEEGEDEEDEEE